MNNKGTTYGIALTILIMALVAANLFFGSVNIPPEAIISILTGGEVEKASWSFIVWEARVPQAITALLCGAALAGSGLMLQTAFNNPLAGPSILGINSGASLGVALVMLLGGGTIATAGITLSGFFSIVLGAFIGLWLTKLDLNMYAQIGLVMLVGLAAKNAILIVEFAVLQMERGQGLIEAAVTAARMRLRPILMTSFAFILGCVPLVTAEGSGALARNSIGVVVVIGMSIATALGVFFIPCSFVFIMKLFRSRIEKGHHGPDPDEVKAYELLEAQENEAR